VLTLREIASMTHGTIVPGQDEPRGDAALASLHVDAIATDSRALPANALFVALVGERFDGHAFVDSVDARALLVEAGRHPSDKPVRAPAIVVTDTRRAYGDLAAAWRARFDLPLVAVVGSNGKTTTKEMIAAILAAAFGASERLATTGNLNNDIGVPATLLGLGTHHRAAVVEIGMNHPGETARLAQIAHPTVAVVVNAQREHQEFMRSVAAVADEHALAIAALPPEGAAVFPADDEHADVWERAAGDRRIVDFACVTSHDAPDAESNDAAVVGRAHLEPEDTILHLALPTGTITARLAVTGMHNARNATAAAAASFAAGIELDAIARGLEAFRPLQGRSRRMIVDGVVLIDDTYNANPDSMRALIDLLAANPPRRLLVMGDMGEVGKDGPRFHFEVGAHAAARGIEDLFALGEASRDAVVAFGRGGRHFDAVEPLVDAVRGWLAGGTGGAIAVKGSRFMRMERVVAGIAGPAEAVH
jgi:UDP-N-acetylmuramoyl-tripeptide--D-alanyl-D-alanine ligase